jgi:serine/threonine protein kinase
MAKSRNRRKEKRAAAAATASVATSSTVSASLVSKSAVPVGGAGAPPPVAAASVAPIAPIAPIAAASVAASVAASKSASKSPIELRAVTAPATKKRLLPANSRTSRITRKAGNATQGAFGRVNIEQLSNSSLVATKYPLSVDSLQDNINEIATLKYLEGLPHVAQFLGTAALNAAGAVCVAFPCVLMESAKSNLHDRIHYTDWETTLKAVIGVLRGYNVLHSSHIVHRDTKPANMLMSMTNEVYITDFGRGRYTTPLISPCQDGYTGTQWFASPEVLLKQVLGGHDYSYEGWFAHDAWAVGASLFYIVTGLYIFRGDSSLDVLKSIYLQKGRPMGKDGEMVELDEDYAHENPMNLMAETVEQLLADGYGLKPGETPATLEAAFGTQKPNNMAFLTVRHSKFDTNMKQLSVVAMMIDRLLDYNPETRLTIRGALKLLAKHRIIGTEDLSFSSGKTLFHQYQILPRTTPMTARSIAKLDIHRLFQWMATIDWEAYENSPATQDIVLDRAFVYFLAAFQKLESVITDRNYVAYGLMCYVIASQLFASTGVGLAIADAAELQQDPKHSESALYKFLKTIILTEIDFFGTTFLDELLLKLPTGLHPRASKINLICHTHTLYNDFLKAGITPPQIIDFLVQAARKPGMNTPEAITEAFEMFRTSL